MSSAGKSLKFTDDNYGVLFIQPFKAVRDRMPGKMGELARSWDSVMLRTFVFSFGNRLYGDQRCHISLPTRFKPLVETAPELQFTEEQIASFYKNGFIGPLTLCSREEMIEIREDIMAAIKQDSKIYGIPTGRDRHLDCEAVYQLVRRPELTERLAQLLGPNLQLWRSQVFLKEPGGPEITWHQASTYLSEEGYKATLFPPDINQLFQLTTWLTFDNVDYENGCMQFVKGSQDSINPLRLQSKKGGSFANVNFKLELDIDPADVVTMEMKAGQFVIFTERCVHGSPPNDSDRRRWGMAFRTIQPEVQVYSKGETKHRVLYLKETYDLSNWAAVQIRGDDPVNINKVIDPFPKAAS